MVYITGLIIWNKILTMRAMLFEEYVEARVSFI
jgi:hypothetical protein